MNQLKLFYWQKGDSTYVAVASNLKDAQLQIKHNCWSADMEDIHNYPQIHDIPCGLHLVQNGDF